MSQEFIVGRTAESPVMISDQCDRVSRRHAIITIDDNGQWTIESLESDRPTFVRDDEGIFRQVFKKNISENTIIRLGEEGHSSFSFMAHRVIEPDQKSYAYEFNQLRKELRRQTEAEEALEKRNARNVNLITLSSPVALCLSVVLQYSIPALQDDANINLWVSRILMCLAPTAARYFFGADRIGAKSLKKRRMRLLTCPKCGLPMSDFDIQNMSCSRCKAK